MHFFIQVFLVGFTQALPPSPPAFPPPPNQQTDEENPTCLC